MATLRAVGLGLVLSACGAQACGRTELALWDEDASGVGAAVGVGGTAAGSVGSGGVGGDAAGGFGVSGSGGVSGAGGLGVGGSGTTEACLGPPRGLLFDYRTYVGDVTFSDSAIGTVLAALRACNITTTGYYGGQPLGDALLGTDVLALLPKSEPVSEADKDEIRAFLARGGGVLMLADYAGPTTTPFEVYQDLFEVFGAIHGNTVSQPYDVYPTLIAHPITEGIATIKFYATTTLFGDGYETVARLGDPVVIARDDGAGRIVITGDMTFVFDDGAGDEHNLRFFVQAVQWLARTR